MAYKTVEVDIELGDFSTEEIISELIYRFNDGHFKSRYVKKELETLYNLLSKKVTGNTFKAETLEDFIKMEILIEAKNKYTSWQLEEKLKQ